VFRHYPLRACLGPFLFIGRAFLYNAITFSFAMILTTFVGLGDRSVTTSPSSPVRIFLGSLVLGKLFDMLAKLINTGQIGDTALPSGPPRTAVAHT
jgi:hypothetical protein